MIIFVTLRKCSSTLNLQIQQTVSAESIGRIPSNGQALSGLSEAEIQQTVSAELDLAQILPANFGTHTNPCVEKFMNRGI